MMTQYISTFFYFEVPPLDDLSWEDGGASAVAGGAEELAEVVTEAKGFHIFHFHPHRAAGAAKVLTSHCGKEPVGEGGEKLDRTATAAAFSAAPYIWKGARLREFSVSHE